MLGMFCIQNWKKTYLWHSPIMQLELDSSIYFHEIYSTGRLKVYSMGGLDFKLDEYVPRRLHDVDFKSRKMQFCDPSLI